MKTPHRQSNFLGNRRGVALLIILLSVALLTILVVAFLAGGLAQVKTAGTYSAGANVKLLAQTAFNTVIAEINDGTSGLDASNNVVAWASQPGMIRTFDKTGALSQFYKLYSSYQMVGTDLTNALGDTSNFSSDASLMKYWGAAPAFFTDLNSPVQVNGVNHYPIICGDSAIKDPVTGVVTMTPMTTANSKTAFTSPAGAVGYTYQTVTGTPDVQGFWVQAQGSGFPLAPLFPTVAAPSNPIPMPVQWLYVLRDGTVYSPALNSIPITIGKANSNGRTVTITQATAANPIVGRIAFWTDDESCKVDINTASEGTYMDTPRVATVPEVNRLANFQPAQHEFQRYPGHPAMTSLSTVLGAWLPLPPPSANTFANPNPNNLAQNAYYGVTAANFATYMEPYYNLTPKLVPGDSSDVNASTGGGVGSLAATTIAAGSASDANYNSVNKTGPLNLTQTQRNSLYNSVDELIFNQNRNTSGTANPPKVSTAPIATLTEGNLEEAKFFLTAHSQSPDVNLFNQPRVGIWPVPFPTAANGLSQTAEDQLIAFCSTVNSKSGPRAYYFARADASNVSPDLALNGVTLGANFDNQALLNYLKCFAKDSIPGFGGKFSDKYSSSTSIPGGTNLDQIFTEIFDYIRMTNLHDVSAGATPYTLNSNSAKNLVVPTVDTSTGTKGITDFPTVTQAALVFICVDDGDWNDNPAKAAYFYDGTGSSTGTPAGQTPYYNNPVPYYAATYGLKPWATPASLSSNPYANTIWPRYATAGNKRIQAALMLNLFNPALGFPSMAPGSDVSYTVDWAAGPQVNGHTLGFNPGVKSTLYNTWQLPENRYYGGNWGACSYVTGNSGFNPFSTYSMGPPVSKVIELPSTGTLNFGGDTAKVTIRYKTNIIQTINFKFPAVSNLPMPKLPNTDLTVAQVPWCQPAAFPSAPTALATTFPTIRPWIVPTAAINATNYSTWASAWNTANPTIPAPILNSLVLDFASFQSRFDYPFNAMVAFNDSSNVWHQYNNVLLGTPNPYDVVRAVQSTSGDYRLIAAKNTILDTDPVLSPHPQYQISSNPMAHSLTELDGTVHYGATRGALAHLAAGSYTPPTNSTGYYANTYWASSISGSIASPSLSTYYAPLGQFPFPLASYPTAVGMTGVTSTMSLTSGGATTLSGGSTFTIESEVRSTDGVVAGYMPDMTQPLTFTDFADKGGITKAIPGDWDNGIANIKDGAYINKPDEGLGFGYTGTQSPYYSWAGTEGAGAGTTMTNFSPNRQIPSAVMFGSLPTGVYDTAANVAGQAPWQTLLFRPNPLGAVASSQNIAPLPPPLVAALQHKGAQSPPDHLLLDLFSMPVVEPYAISEPLTTAGRINMNYQIVPFTYINRDTGLRAVFKAERLLAIPNADGGGNNTTSGTRNVGPYKTFSFFFYDKTGATLGSNSGVPAYLSYDLRFDINADETLKGFQARFNAKDIFRSPSEICTVDLIPQDNGQAPEPSTPLPSYSADGSGSAMVAYWQAHALTGDNSRERPYADIYPRLTTKSNTYTVHVRVQTLKQALPPNSTATAYQTWREGTDQVTGEFRGSETIERYIDPNNSHIPDYVKSPSTNPPGQAIGQYYKFRVVNSKQFAP